MITFLRIPRLSWRAVTIRRVMVAELVMEAVAVFWMFIKVMI